MTELPIINTGNWNKDIQTDIDDLFGLDGDPYFLTEEDLFLSTTFFCNRQSMDPLLKEVVCGSYDIETKTKWIRNLRGRFASDNPVHALMKREASVAPPEDIKYAYDVLHFILFMVKDNLQGHPDLPPDQKIAMVYEIIKRLEYKLSADDRGKTYLLSEQLKKKTSKKLDCYPASFIIYIVAQELKWPVCLVEAPGHLFTRWDDENSGVRFNMDYGYQTTDEFYVEKFPFFTDKRVKRKDIYLKNLSQNEIMAIFYERVAVAKGKLADASGKKEEAVKLYTAAYEDWKEALKLYPNSPSLLVNLGAAEAFLMKWKDCIRHCTMAIEQEPTLTGAYYNRGYARLKTNDYGGAISDFEEVLRNEPGNQNAIVMFKGAQRRQKPKK